MASNNAARRKGRALPAFGSEVIPDTPENQAAWETFPSGPRPRAWIQAALERLSFAQLTVLLGLVEAELDRRGLAQSRGEE
jgi:hypothetical protein